MREPDSHDLDVLLRSAARVQRTAVDEERIFSDVWSRVQVVTLTTWEHLTPAEAARVVGITAGTARLRLHRARARLARHPRLQALLDGPDGGPSEGGSVRTTP